MAKELHQSLLELTDWARRHGNSVAAAQAAYDRGHIPALPVSRLCRLDLSIPRGPSDVEV